MKAKRCVIVGILDEWAQARGNYDVEYALCRMTTGGDKTFETDDPEFEEFVNDRDAYWKARGWTLEERGEKKVLAFRPETHAGNPAD